MAQAYGPAFARVYNRLWAGFAAQHAPLIREYYAGTAIGRINRDLLDVCCGTGQLARHFLEHGYRVTGVDLSEPMLALARENCREYTADGRARFVQADASQFAVGGPFGLAVSTFDALNHLSDFESLAGCFKSVRAALAQGGWFIFDLNTRLGLRRWNTIHVDDTEELMLVNRGVYDGRSDRAYTILTGFTRNADGAYDRFEEAAYNTVFDLGQVRGELLATGWRAVHFARAQALASPLDDPESEGRVFVVAHKGGASESA